MAAALSLALLAACAAMCVSSVAADCSVDVDSGSMPSPQPVLLASGYSQDYSSFLLPNLKGNLTVSRGQRVTVACPGTTFVLLDGATDRVTAECVGDTTFSVDSVQHTLNGLACADDVRPATRYASASCGAGGRFGVVEVGFAVGTEFHYLYDVCFSNKTLTTFYTHHTIPAGIDGAQETTLEVDWDDGSFYGQMDIEGAYLDQNVTIDELLNGDSSEVLFAEGRLERGALAPPADFMLEAHQVATFYGINSAPRWTQLDEGNWGKLEEILRTKASQRARDLEVYTGTHGVLALNNDEGVPTAIYLSAADSGKKALAVPKYFWKIVYEPVSGLSAAFITVNNPNATKEDLDARYRLCADICSKIDWLTWDQNNQAGGLSYCCDYNEFKQVVLGVPELHVTGYVEHTSGAFMSAPAMGLIAILVATLAFKSSLGVV